ncbi:DUF6708 domain-containing protein [Caldimonas brevitalea]|uniref:DUF6708 domain-containing protein n=1 Tax=Caldimonas brevitalea TaxID=413882 RepID=A0A0G3BV00_9BURK|nr:DUF6708 domain-containing protein [Caldimonas brevitalea]AKJ30335.1 hypothetical protein AAW51_3644 [Caldimonas brevitalea]
MTQYTRRRAAELQSAAPDTLYPDASEAKRLDKRKSVSDTPSSMGLLQKNYENAIALEASFTRTRGIVSTLALMFVPIAILGMFLLDLFVDVLRTNLRGGSAVIAFMSFVLAAAGLLIILCASAGAIRAFRIDLFSPLGMPILFNRKTRKVYRFIQDMPGIHFSAALVNMKYWPGVFKRWPLILVEYDWDCLEAEHAKETRVSGNVVQTLHELRFIAKESPGSGRVVDGFTVASPLMLGSETWPELWEFIRRYMEEQSLAALDNESFAPEPPKTLFQAATAVAPAGWVWAVAGGIGTAWIAWRSGIPEGSLASITWFLFAVFSGLTLVIIMFNWLAHRLAPRVELPADLLAEAGAPIEPSNITIKASAK